MDAEPNQQRTLNKLPTELRCYQAPTEHTNWASNVQKRVCYVCVSDWASILHTTVGGWEDVEVASKKNKTKICKFSDHQNHDRASANNTTVVRQKRLAKKHPWHFSRLVVGRNAATKSPSPLPPPLAADRHVCEIAHTCQFFLVDGITEEKLKIVTCSRYNMIQ